MSSLQFTGHVYWANGIPAKDVKVEVFDRDPSGTDDNMTTSTPRTNGEGFYSGWHDPIRAVDMITREVEYWAPADPQNGDFRPVNKTKWVSVPDPAEIFIPYLKASYRINQRDYAYVSELPGFNDDQIVLPQAGISTRQTDLATVKYPDGCLALVAKLSKDEQDYLCVIEANADGEWGNWVKLGGVPHGAAFAVTRGNGAELHVFTVNAENAVRHCLHSQGSSTQPAWDSRGGWTPLDTAMAAARNADGRVEIFKRGADNQLWHMWQWSNGTWSAWECLGGSLLPGGAIAVDQNLDGRLEVFAQWQDGSLRHIWQTAPNNGWSGWASFGQELSPGALATCRDRLDRLAVAVQSLDGAVALNCQTSPNNGWGGWVALDGMWDCRSLGLIADLDGRLNVFVEGPSTSHGTRQRRQSNVGNWSGSAWQSIGAPPDSWTRATTVGIHANGRLEAFQRILNWDEQEPRISIRKSSIHADQWGTWRWLPEWPG